MLILFFYLVLAFFDFSSLRTHFWPFTDVVRKIRREVTRKVILAACGNGAPSSRQQCSRLRDATAAVHMMP